MALSINTFPLCCGIRIISNFGRNHEQSIIIHTIRETETNLKELIFRYSEIAMLLVALNPYQKSKFHKMLLRQGFKLVSQGYNGSHARNNYLYSHEIKRGRKIL